MGEESPKGRIDRVPKEFRGAHAPSNRPESEDGKEMDSIWKPMNTSEFEEKPPKFKQVSDQDINNNPENNHNNPERLVDGFNLINIKLRNTGYKEGSFEMIEIPQGGRIRFLTKPTFNTEQGVHDWYIQGFDQDGKSLGAGFISTWNKRGAIITTKDKRRLTLFRPELIVRR